MAVLEKPGSSEIGQLVDAETVLIRRIALGKEVDVLEQKVVSLEDLLDLLDIALDDLNLADKIRNKYLKNLKERLESTRESSIQEQEMLSEYATMESRLFASLQEPEAQSQALSEPAFENEHITEDESTTEHKRVAEPEPEPKIDVTLVDKADKADKTEETIETESLSLKPFSVQPEEITSPHEEPEPFVPMEEGTVQDDQYEGGMEVSPDLNESIDEVTQGLTLNMVQQARSSSGSSEEDFDVNEAASEEPLLAEQTEPGSIKDGSEIEPQPAITTSLTGLQTDDALENLSPEDTFSAEMFGIQRHNGETSAHLETTEESGAVDDSDSSDSSDSESSGDLDEKYSDHLEQYLDIDQGQPEMSLAVRLNPRPSDMSHVPSLVHQSVALSKMNGAAASLKDSADITDIMVPAPQVAPQEAPHVAAGVQPVELSAELAQVLKRGLEAKQYEEIKKIVMTYFELSIRFVLETPNRDVSPEQKVVLRRGLVELSAHLIDCAESTESDKSSFQFIMALKQFQQTQEVSSEVSLITVTTFRTFITEWYNGLNKVGLEIPEFTGEENIVAHKNKEWIMKACFDFNIDSRFAVNDFIKNQKAKLSGLQKLTVEQETAKKERNAMFRTYSETTAGIKLKEIDLQALEDEVAQGVYDTDKFGMEVWELVADHQADKVSYWANRAIFKKGLLKRRLKGPSEMVTAADKIVSNKGKHLKFKERERTALVKDVRKRMLDQMGVTKFGKLKEIRTMKAEAFNEMLEHLMQSSPIHLLPEYKQQLLDFARKEGLLGRTKYNDAQRVAALEQASSPYCESFMKPLAVKNPELFVRVLYATDPTKLNGAELHANYAGCRALLKSPKVAELLEKEPIVGHVPDVTVLFPELELNQYQKFSGSVQSFLTLMQGTDGTSTIASTNDVTIVEVPEEPKAGIQDSSSKKVKVTAKKWKALDFSNPNMQALLALNYGFSCMQGIRAGLGGEVAMASTTGFDSNSLSSDYLQLDKVVNQVKLDIVGLGQELLINSQPEYKKGKAYMQLVFNEDGIPSDTCLLNSDNFQFRGGWQFRPEVKKAEPDSKASDKEQ